MKPFSNCLTLDMKLMQCVTERWTTWFQGRWQLSIMHMVHCHDRLAYCFPQSCSNPSNGLLLNQLELSKLLICHHLDRYPLWNWYPPNKDHLCVCVYVCVCVRVGLCVFIHTHFVRAYIFMWSLWNRCVHAHVLQSGWMMMDAFMVGWNKGGYKLKKLNAALSAEWICYFWP